MVDFPVRNQQQKIGDAAARHFDNSIPSRWAINKSESDYGWDRIILITTEGSGEAREEFYVQIKGSCSADYILDNSFLSLSVERKTVNFLSTREMPVMIAFCDMARPDKPIYWIWLHAAIEEIEKRNVRWQKQETLTIRIPTSQLLANEIDRIESDVRHHASESRLAKMMLEMLSPHEKRSLVSLPSAAGIDETYLTTQFLPLVSIPSAVLDSAGSIGADSRRDQLQKVSTLLQENRDIRAEEILNELEGDIEHTSPQIRATFHNCKGIVAFHRFQLKEAQKLFVKAVELNPSEPKFLTNVLNVEYVVSGKDNLPDDWRDRLFNVVSRHPTFIPAARLQIQILAHDSGLEVAEEFAINSPAFSLDSKSLLVVLAQTFGEKGDVERALKFISSAEMVAPEDPELLSVKAILLLRKAMDFRGEPTGLYYIDGYGPPDLDIDTLKESVEVFNKACIALTNAGLPLWAETTFSNAASAFVMAHCYSDARYHCEVFFKRHPSSITMSAAMAMVLYHSGEAFEAIKYASTVYDARRDSKSFKNLLLTLIKATEYEKALDVVLERQDSGFADEDEKALALHLAAIAFTELGEHDKARKCVEQIRAALNRGGDAAAADIFLARRNGVERSEIMKMINAGLKLYPGHPILEADLVQSMLPVSPENAESLVQHIPMLAKKRQLAIWEVAALGEAYFKLRLFSEAEIVFRSGAKRFPSEPEFIMNQAYALHSLGRDEEAFQALNPLLAKTKHSFALVKNLGHLARITGRLDDAIKMFEQAVGRTPNSLDRAELHCLLYELHKRKGDSIKEQVRHAVQFGKMCGTDPESEARYLIMFFLATPDIKEADKDDEFDAWIAEFQGRVKLFSTNHPRFHALITLKSPDGMSQQEAAHWLFTEMASLMLSASLVRGRHSIRLREGAWPLATRAELLGAGSLCEYWDNCTRSEDPVHAIYIFASPLNFEEEVQAVTLRSAVCVDITTLLTLKLLNLLDDVLNAFECWIIAAGTREALENDSNTIGEPQPIATGLLEWLIKNRSKIRTRQLPSGSRRDDRSDGYILQSGIWIQNKRTISDLVGKGVGETLLLAQHLKLPLYSDEACIRVWGGDQYRVKSFSTVSLLRRLRAESRLSLDNETALIVTLLRNNYRFIPFGEEHLNRGLDNLLQANPDPTSADMSKHSILGPLLKEFGELKLDEQSLINVAATWWVDLAGTPSISEKTCIEVLTTLTFRLSERVKDSVLSEVSPKRQLMRRCSIWASFLVLTYNTNASSLSRCWAGVKGAAASLILEEEIYNKCLQEYVPQILYRIMKTQSSDRLVDALVAVPEGLTEPERTVWQRLLLRLAKRDGLVH